MGMTTRTTRESLGGMEGQEEELWEEPGDARRTTAKRGQTMGNHLDT